MINAILDAFQRLFGVQPDPPRPGWAEIESIAEEVATKVAQHKVRAIVAELRAENPRARSVTLMATDVTVRLDVETR